MSNATTPSAPTDKTLTEQQIDFTAEGSPPPGKVSTVKPATTPAPPTQAPHDPEGQRQGEL